MQGRFKNRAQAGQELAKPLQSYAGRPDTLILGLPRGGVPVAAEMAKILSLPLDVWLVRKLGVPEHEELAMGAMTMDGTYHINDQVAHLLGVSETMIGQVVQKERRELDRRNRLYRGGRTPPQLKGKTVIVVDDGLATGATMRAAAESLRESGVAHIVVAVPVGSEDACRALSGVADEVVCALRPAFFHAVGQWYEDFTQTSDAEVKALLAAHHTEAA